MSYCVSQTLLVNHGLFLFIAAPSKVEDVTVVRTSDTSVTVTWRRLSIVEARGIITGYTVEYKPSEQQNRQVQLVNVGPEERTVMVAGLDPQVAYHVVVHATTAAGSSVSDAVIIQAGKFVARRQ